MGIALTQSGNTAKAGRPFATGVFSTFCVFAPLYGPLFGVPASLLSAFTLPLVMLAVLMSYRTWPPSRIWLAAVLFLTVILTSLISANAGQWDFMLNLSQWSRREQSYVEAKLLMLMVSAGPAFVVILLIATIEDKERLVRGCLAAIVAIAVFAALRVAVEDGAALIRTDLGAATSALLASSYSRVGYGVLLALGALAALRFRFGWIIAALLLFFCALLSRRADTLAVGSALLGLICAFSLNGRKVSGARFVGVLVLAGVAFLLLHNEQNLAYFSGFWDGVETRSEMIAESSAAFDASETVTGTDGPIAASPAAHRSPSLFSGFGLGEYQSATGGRFFYPHNLALELALEQGYVAAAAYLLLMLSPLVWVGSLVVRGRASASSIYVAACLAVYIILSFKAADLTFLGRGAFLAALTLLAAHTSVPRRG